MRYTVTKQVIQVIGFIWMPSTNAAQERELTRHDFESISNPKDRDAVQSWIDTHFGDFQQIVDFRADFHVGDEHIVHEWKFGEDSECAFNDMMYPTEEE